jgi:hypothetical protein
MPFGAIAILTVDAHHVWNQIGESSRYPAIARHFALHCCRAVVNGNNTEPTTNAVLAAVGANSRSNKLRQYPFKNFKITIFSISPYCQV